MTTFAATTNADAFSALRNQAAASGVILGTLSDVAATALTVANVLGGGATAVAVPAANVTSGKFGATTSDTGRYAFPALSIETITVSDLGTTQSSTPSAAQLLTGLVTQTGVTGAGTVTLPIGSLLDTAVGALTTLAVGTSFRCRFANLAGGTTLTLTGDTGTVMKGTVAVGSGKEADLLFNRVTTNSWVVYVVVSA